MKIKNFPGLGRELEVDEEPEGIFADIQNDLSTCSEAGKNIMAIKFIMV